MKLCLTSLWSAWSDVWINPGSLKGWCAPTGTALQNNWMRSKKKADVAVSPVTINFNVYDTVQLQLTCLTSGQIALCSYLMSYINSWYKFLFAFSQHWSSLVRYAVSKFWDRGLIWFSTGCSSNSLLGGERGGKEFLLPNWETCLCGQPERVGFWVEGFAVALGSLH